MKIIFPNEIGVRSAFLKQATRKRPKLARTLTSIEECLPASLELLDIHFEMQHSSFILEFNAMDPKFATTIARRLQRKAFPKSQWYYAGCTNTPYGVMRAHLTFIWRNNGTKKEE